MKKILIPFLTTLAVFAQEETKKLEQIVTTDFKTKLDEINRNVYIIDKDMIENKGYTSLNQVFSYAPFVGFSNTGMGTNIDLRGQGNSANVSTKVLLNGIGLNMLDSSHGVTPLDSISINDVESIEILPGGGAVMYGNGTRGGVVNIITKKRYDQFNLSTGISYNYSNGSRPQFDIKLGDKIKDNLFYTLSARYLFQEGYRNKDIKHLGNIGGNFTWDINSNHSISFDFNYFKGVDFSTPVLRFSDISNPSKSDRTKAGNGDITTLQDRISLSLNYDYKITENQSLNLKTFYHYYKFFYDKNLQVLNYNYGNFHLENTRVNQKGSYFVDSKAGIQAKYDFKHKNGLFILGFDSIYNQGIRNLNLNIDWTGNITIPSPSPSPSPSAITGYDHSILTYVNAIKLSNAIYAIEKYDFTKNFSLTTGGRYEFAWYDGYRTLNNKMAIGMGPAVLPISPYSLYKKISDTSHNFAFELIPKYSFNIGDLYFKYEHGFRSPNPDNLTSRNGSNSRSNYINTNVKSENYDTFEIGTKLFTTNTMFLLTFFYTLTQDEIYSVGSAHTGNGFSVGNYDLTQRAGVELASEQFFFDGILSLNESFSYIDARILRDKGKHFRDRLVPYVSNYKATIGANYEFIKNYTLWIQNSFIGAQRDTAQNKIKPYSLTDIGLRFKNKFFSVTVGIRNLFDTFYYTFYNRDQSDEVTGYAFTIGQGRSYFIEGRYQF
ncbi:MULTISPECIES: TonB-dependent receptor [unclassified Helicobacter]|uniref:TonB-dependent receptor n=1 Tax=unclassified Helicobacter TaxID=2593540 RepID=UPI000CF083E7|nr:MULTISPECIES: TonB-dependent receptor [unclassified Helicobacter]